MENSLGLLDGKILLVSLISIVLGWLIRWAVARRATKVLRAQAESEVEAKSANIDALKHDLILRDRTISEQKESLAELNKELTSQAERILSRETDVNDLTSKLDLLDSSQSESGEAIAVLEDAVAGLEEQLSVEKLSLEKLDEKHAEEVSQLESRYSSIAEQLSASDKANQNLTSELIATKEAAEKLRFDIAAKNDAIEKRAAPLNQLKDELTQLTQLRKNDRGERSNLESSLAIWQTRAEKAESQLAAARKDLLDSQQANNKPRAPDPSYEKLLLLKDQEISAQKSQTHEAQSRLLSVRDTIGAHENEIHTLKDQLQKQNAESKRELASMQRKFEEQHLSNANTARELGKQRESFQERIDKLASENTSKSRKLATTTESLTELNEGNKSLLQDLNQSANKLRIQRDEINTLISINENLEAQLAHSSTERGTVRRNLDKVQRELHAKNSAIAELNAALAENKAALQRCQTELRAKPQQSHADHQAPKLHSSKPAQVDDLKKIKGIGPALEKMLNDLGIYQFAQVASLNNNEVSWVDEHIESFKGRIYRDEWVAQAKRLRGE